MIGGAARSPRGPRGRRRATTPRNRARPATPRRRRAGASPVAAPVSVSADRRAAEVAGRQRCLRRRVAHALRVGAELAARSVHQAQHAAVDLRALRHRGISPARKLPDDGGASATRTCRRPTATGSGPGTTPDIDTRFLQFRGLSLYTLDLAFTWQGMLTSWFGLHAGAGLGLGRRARQDLCQRQPGLHRHQPRRPQSMSPAGRDLRQRGLHAGVGAQPNRRATTCCRSCRWSAPWSGSIFDCPTPRVGRPRSKPDSSTRSSRGSAIGYTF